MARHRQRTRVVDVTKSLLSSRSMAELITVHVSPTQSVQVAEEEMSVTQGSLSAAALRNMGKLDVSLQLCSNWRAGACHNSTGCHFAHVLGYLGVDDDNNNNSNSSSSDAYDERDTHRTHMATTTAQQQQQQQQQHLSKSPYTAAQHCVRSSSSSNNNNTTAASSGGAAVAAVCGGGSGEAVAASLSPAAHVHAYAAPFAFAPPVQQQQQQQQQPHMMTTLEAAAAATAACPTAAHDATYSSNTWSQQFAPVPQYTSHANDKDDDDACVWHGADAQDSWLVFATCDTTTTTPLQAAATTPAPPCATAVLPQQQQQQQSLLLSFDQASRVDVTHGSTKHGDCADVRDTQVCTPAVDACGSSRHNNNNRWLYSAQYTTTNDSNNSNSTPPSVCSIRVGCGDKGESLFANVHRTAAMHPSPSASRDASASVQYLMQLLTSDAY